MPDPTSRAAIVAFKRGASTDREGHAAHATSREVATTWLVLEQINVLREALLMPPISAAQARDEIIRLTRVIDALPDGS